MRKILLLGLLLLPAVVVSSQNELYEEPVVVYNRQFYGGFNLNTRGFGGFFNYGWNKGAYNVRLFTFDVLFVKHEKETKSYFQDPNARSYFYGKKNNFYELRPGFGHKHIISEKLRKNGVQVGYTWSAGPVFGFTKPVYLEILYLAEGSGTNYSIAVEKFDPNEHYIDNIYGRASGLRGLGELKFHPGVYARAAFFFEYSGYKDGIKGIEIGASADLFPKPIEIMSQEILDQRDDGARNHQLFISFYLNFLFGKKFNKE